MQLFKEILKQNYPLKDVCMQIKANMDHASRLQMIHVLFGLSQADGHVHPLEVKVIHTIANYLGISGSDFESIQAMFYKDTAAAYKILEITLDVTDDEVKKAYRKMAAKFHPDKVHHLGDEFQKMAEEKFKSVNDAYQQIKKERGMK
jgi:DnaJ like chaperone protein